MKYKIKEEIIEGTITPIPTAQNDKTLTKKVNLSVKSTAQNEPVAEW